MEHDQVLNRIAPCGLRCDKCFAFTEGSIANTAKEMIKHLGAFDIYAERFSAFLPEFKNYPAFKELLHHFANPDCRGCRKGDCKYPNCGVAQCHKEKAVEFCFQCDEFPCEKTNFDPHLKARWIKMNERMKEIGIPAYEEETKDKPRYV